MKSLLGLTTSAYDPASRFRFVQFIPYLERAGWHVTHRANRPDRQWSSDLPTRLARAAHYRAGRFAMKINRRLDLRDAGSYDVVFVNRDLAGRGLALERTLHARNPRVVFDFDDAIFVGPEEQSVAWACRQAAWVTPGNEYLAAWARRHTDRVTLIPTVIDTDLCVPNGVPSSPGPIRVGWSGSDQSIRDTLFPILPLLAQLQRELGFQLVIITNTRPDLPVDGLEWTFVPWTAEGESTLGARMDIGLMPLIDNAFQRGKCGLKLLQYMAVGIPAIASPVGVNREIVAQGQSGFLPENPREWREALSALVRSPELRLEVGRAGRRRCAEEYSIHKWLPALIDILERVRQAR